MNCIQIQEEALNDIIDIPNAQDKRIYKNFNKEAYLMTKKRIRILLQTVTNIWKKCTGFECPVNQ